MDKTNDAVASRAEIARALPRAIRTALASYQRFIQQEDSEDAKSFKAHHDACKVAIAHIDLLIKLAESIEAKQQGDAPDVSDQDELMARLIESAREVQDCQDYLAKFSE